MYYDAAHDVPARVFISRLTSNLTYTLDWHEMIQLSPPLFC